MSRVGSKIIDELRHDLQSVRMAIYIFSDISIARELCSAYQRNRYKLTIYSQSRGPSGHTAVGISPEVVSTLTACMSGDDFRTIEIGCDIWSDTSCRGRPLSTLHTKLIEIHRENGNYAVITGSGNLGRGLYSNLEDWLFFNNSNYLVHLCVWKTIEALAEGHSDAQAVFNSCSASKQVETFSDGAGSFIFLPFEAEAYYQRFYEEAAGADEITIVSMDFKDRRLAGSLRSALQRGATLMFYVSSDWYHAARAGVKVGNAAVDEISFANTLEQSFPGQVEIRFVDVNFFSSTIRNNLHHKFALFERKDGEATVITGTVNMNRGAISNNLDQAYVLGGETALAYAEYISWLGEVSLPYREMPISLPRIDGDTVTE